MSHFSCFSRKNNANLYRILFCRHIKNDIFWIRRLYNQKFLWKAFPLTQNHSKILNVAFGFSFQYSSSVSHLACLSFILFLACFCFDLVSWHFGATISSAGCVCVFAVCASLSHLVFQRGFCHWHQRHIVGFFGYRLHIVVSLFFLIISHIIIDAIIAQLYGMHTLYTVNSERFSDANTTNKSTHNDAVLICCCVYTY